MSDRVGRQRHGPSGLLFTPPLRPRPAMLPAIVEIVGPAASGKSTLARSLCARNGQIVEGARLNLSRPRHLPFVLSRGLSLLPACCPGIGWCRDASREEIKKMIYLSGWDRVLARQLSRSRSLLVLDQGPVFNLATLQAFGRPRMAGAPFERWSNRMIDRWRGMLDLVIRLDAEDGSLIERIRDREKKHEIKDGSIWDMKSYLNRYRSAYDNVIARIAESSAVEVLTLDTDRLTPEQTVEEVEKALGRFG